MTNVHSRLNLSFDFNTSWRLSKSNTLFSVCLNSNTRFHLFLFFYALFFFSYRELFFILSCCFFVVSGTSFDVCDLCRSLLCNETGFLVLELTKCEFTKRLESMFFVLFEINIVCNVGFADLIVRNFARYIKTKKLVLIILSLNIQISLAEIQSAAITLK